MTILLIGLISIFELLIVKSNILRCFGDPNISSSEMNSYLLLYLFVVFLRNGSFYLFFTVLRLYQQSKKNRITDRETALKDTGTVIMMPIRGKQIALNIKQISYFSHKKNISFVHRVKGQAIAIYSTLANVQDYLGAYCLRINKENVITFSNIVNYNKERVIVKGGSDRNISLLYAKKDVPHILQTLRLKAPDLEEKNATSTLKNDTFGGVSNRKDDENNSIGGVKNQILEEIKKKEGMHVWQLAEIFEGRVSQRTIERRLKKLKEEGVIEFRGSDKNGGYHMV